MIQRGGDAAGDEGRADGVAESGALHDDRLAGFAEHVANAAARPKRAGVKAAAFAFGSLRSLPRSPGVDDLRIDLLDVVIVDLQAATRCRQEAGEEDVRLLDQPIQHFAAAVSGQVEAEAALVAAAV